MERKDKVRRKELIKSKMRTGDLLTASEMLCITTDAARMRLYRCNEDMLQAVEMVILTRENLIRDYRKHLNYNL